MPISEKTYRDRQTKAEGLRDACAGFSPAFVPADASLTVANFSAFLAGGGGVTLAVEAANTAVETLESGYTSNATTRVALVKTIRAAATQATGYVKSNKAWKNEYKAVKRLADKLRGVVPPKKTAPPPPPGSEPPAEAKKRNQGQQAYGEILAHLSGLTAALTACPGYNPPGAEITISKFNEYQSSLRSLNAGLSQTENNLGTARSKRQRLYYEGEACLEAKFQAIKNAVKGQYGQASAEYGAVKGKKW
jgi:hypothetical protein